MTPRDLAQHLTRLDWSGASLTHRLAVGAAIATLTALERPMPALASPPAPTNVIPLPARRKNRWTTLHQLDGRPWATSFDFGPGGAWAWVVETVAHEWDVPEDSVGSLEGDSEQYDGDDLVTIDGVPAYRLKTSWK